MRDSDYFDKQFPYQTFTDHYSIKADLWSAQKDEKTIIKFSSEQELRETTTSKEIPKLGG
jgi:hypothetical protein